MAGGNATSKTNIRRWKKRVTELLDEAFDEGSRDAAVHGVVSDHLALATTEEARGILQKSKHKWKELVPPEFIQDICHEVSAFSHAVTFCFCLQVCVVAFLCRPG